MNPFKIILIAAALAYACGKSDQKVQTVNHSSSKDAAGTDGAFDISKLDPATCNSVTSFTVSDGMNTYQPSDTQNPAVPATATAQLTGNAMSPVSWTLTVNLTGGTPGCVLLAPLQIPQWAQPANSSTIGQKLITGTPQATDAVAAGSMSFIARNMGKCKLASGSNLSACTASPATYNANYDKYIAIPYTIGTNGALPTYYPTPVPTVCVQSTPNPSSSIISGIAGTLFGGIGSAIGGMIGGGSKTPTVTCY